VAILLHTFMKISKSLKKWTTILKTFIKSPFSYETLSHRPETATFLITRKSKKSIFRFVDLTLYSIDQLTFEWDFLEAHKSIKGFPSQTPLNFFNVSETVKCVELSYIEGKHPRANSKSDFFIYGQTLAKFHQFSKGQNYDGLPTWNAERVLNPFSNPILLDYFTEKQKTVAFRTIERITYRFEEYWQQNEWTGIIHSDTHKHNIILNDIQGYLIDFGECGKGVLFWDLGVAIADSEMDYPKFARQCRENLISGYLSVIPKANRIIENDVEIFTKMRVLEVMTWPVSSWTEEYRLINSDRAKRNIKSCVTYLEQK
jgi:Ser/Thr protein kinase RdoA (MazF antagonist)